MFTLGEELFFRDFFFFKSWIEILTVLSVDFRTLDNGEVDFHTERVQQNCSNDSEQDARSVEDIGPQEEGDYSVVSGQ